MDGCLVTLKGWARTNRNNGKIGFIAFNDGSVFPTLQLVYEKEDEARRPEPAEANPQPEGRLVAPGERVRDSVRHAKRERGQDEVDEGGVPHEPVDSRVAPAGGALPQEHAYEEGQAIEGGDEYDDAKEARHELKRVGHVSGERLEGNMGPPWTWDIERAGTTPTVGGRR